MYRVYFPEIEDFAYNEFPHCSMLLRTLKRSTKLA